MSFGQWLLVSVPFCVICTIIAWLLILILVEPDDISSIPIIVYERGDILGRRNITVMVLSFTTLLIFAFFEYFKPYFGDIGIVSLCFVTIMFGSGMLSEVNSHKNIKLTKFIMKLIYSFHIIG